MRLILHLETPQEHELLGVPLGPSHLEAVSTAIIIRHEAVAVNTDFGGKPKDYIHRAYVELSLDKLTPIFGVEFRLLTGDRDDGRASEVRDL